MSRIEHLPDGSRRVVLWKRDGIDMDRYPPAEGASARVAATVTPPAPYVETATDRKARRLSRACDLMAEELETMRGDGTPQAVIRAHEQSYGRMHAALVALHDPAAARLLRGEVVDDVNPNERTSMPTDLRKRAIGSDGAKPAASDGLRTLQEIEDRQQTMAPLLVDLDSDIRKMRRGSPQVAPHVLERHERAHRALSREYRALDEARGLAERVRARRAESGDAPLTEAAALQKSDTSLSPLEAMKQAIRADPDGYFEQSGTARPAPATGRQLAKAEGGTYAEQSGAVEARASVLEKSENLSPTRAYAKALAESGHYARTGAAA